MGAVGQVLRTNICSLDTNFQSGPDVPSAANAWLVSTNYWDLRQGIADPTSA